MPNVHADFTKAVLEALPSAYVVAHKSGWFILETAGVTATIKVRHDRHSSPKNRWWYAITTTDLTRADWICLYGSQPGLEAVSFWLVIPSDWIRRIQHLLRERPRPTGSWDFCVRLHNGHLSLYRKASELDEDLSPFLNNFAAMAL
jgi:hypothetical protein